MKNQLRIILIAVFIGFSGLGNAQNYLNGLKNPEPDDIVLGILSIPNHHQGDCSTGCVWGTKVQWYDELLLQAKLQFPSKKVDIRQMVPTVDDHTLTPWKGPVRGVVIEIPSNNTTSTTSTSVAGTLNRAMEKALRNVREGSRIAIDNVNVIGTTEISREELKDMVIDALLDNGYKVVAKDFLERLYAEQQNQQSGIYNDRTTVIENNFSAVGYYVNVKVTETSLRFQVVNVSTGEFEGNATVNF